MNSSALHLLAEEADGESHPGGYHDTRSVYSAAPSSAIPRSGYGPPQTSHRAPSVAQSRASVPQTGSPASAAPSGIPAALAEAFAARGSPADGGYSSARGGGGGSEAAASRIHASPAAFNRHTAAQQDRAAELRELASFGVPADVAGYSEDELDDLVKKLAEEVARKEHGSNISADVLRRVEAHVRATEGRAHDVLPRVEDAFLAVREALLTASKARANFAAEAGVQRESVAAIPEGPPVPPEDPLFADALPSVAALTSTSSWLHWAFRQGLPLVLQDDAELRSAAFMRVMEENRHVHERLQGQAAVLADAQEALEGAASKLELARVQQSEVQEQITRVDKDIAVVEKERSSDNTAALSAELNRVHEELSSTRRLAEDAAIALSSAEQHKADAQLRHREETEKLADAERKLEQTRNAASNAKEEVISMNQKAASVEASVAGLQREIAKVRAASSGAQEDADDNEAKVGEILAAGDRVAAELRAAKRALESFKQEVAERTAAAERAPKELQGLQETVDGLVKERAQLRKRLAEEEMDAEAASEEAKTAQERTRYLSTLLPSHHPLKRQILGSRSGTPTEPAAA